MQFHLLLVFVLPLVKHPSKLASIDPPETSGQNGYQGTRPKMCASGGSILIPNDPTPTPQALPSGAKTEWPPILGSLGTGCFHGSRGGHHVFDVVGQVCPNQTIAQNSFGSADCPVRDTASRIFDCKVSTGNRPDAVLDARGIFFQSEVDCNQHSIAVFNIENDLAILAPVPAECDPRASACRTAALSTGIVPLVQVEPEPKVLQQERRVEAQEPQHVRRAASGRPPVTKVLFLVIFPNDESGF